MSRNLFGAIGAAVVIVVVAVVVLSSSGSNDSSSTGTDGAFITEMFPHHESAVEMAKIARQRAGHPEIANLANNIVSSQSKEIDELTAAHERLFDEPISADDSTLGLPEAEMGMSMDTSMLETAKPFDRAFIDMMVPHHQGAIRMARIELSDGSDPEMKSLAQDIIDAQSSEIMQMNDWRTKWYGAPSPAGGVPSA